MQLAIKLYLAAQTGGASLAAEGAMKALKPKEFAKAAKSNEGVSKLSPQTKAALDVLNEEQLDSIASQIQQVDGAQTAVLQALRGEVSASAQLALAKASDSTTQRGVIESKVLMLTQELEALQNRFNDALSPR